MRPDISTIFAPLLILAAAAPVSAAPPPVTVVVGVDNVAVDRANLQTAIDAAPDGSTVQLVGTFRLDGERVRLENKTLVLSGESIDNDGDGRAQEDWADGVDNDGDGAVDEDGWETWLFGVDAGGGSPAVDNGVNGLFNRGFAVDGVGGVLRDLTIRDLAFSTFHRAIEIIPEWDSPTGRCEDRTQVAGSVRRLTIEGSYFDNNVLGITLLGDISGSTVRRNVFGDNDVFGVVLEGGTVGCPLAGGSDVDLALTTPRVNELVDNVGADSSIATSVTMGSRVARNELAGGGIFTLDDRNTRVEDNTLNGGFFGIIVDGGNVVYVEDNHVDVDFEGIIAGGAVDQVFIRRNEVSAAFIALDITFGSSGFRAIDNELSAGFFVDLLLDSGSSNNTVINNGDPVTVLDLGTDNRLIGNFDPL